MSRAKKSMLHITTFLPSFAIGMFLNHQLITSLPWPRPHLFFLTLGLFLTTFPGGFILEERFVWKGPLSESEGPWTGLSFKFEPQRLLGCIEIGTPVARSIFS